MGGIGRWGGEVDKSSMGLICVRLKSHRAAEGHFKCITNRGEELVGVVKWKKKKENTLVDFRLSRFKINVCGEANGFDAVVNCTGKEIIL